MNRSFRRPAAARRRRSIWSRNWSGAGTRSTYFVRKSLTRKAWRNNSTFISTSSRHGRWAVTPVCGISNEFAAKTAARGFPREKILLIYYGYDAANFPFRPQPLLERRPAVVVMHGSFDAHHLGEIAFDAIRHVVQNRPGTIFRFVGRR